MEVNYDILSVVSQLLAQLRRFKDVSSMAQTCRFLHVECVSLLLTPRHLYLRNDKRIESFGRFMLADKRRRFPLLSQCHSLHIITPHALSKPVADILVETLGNVTTIRYLRFGAFEKLASSPHILPALATALTWLYHLEVECLASSMREKRFYVKFLKTLQAPALKAINLSLPFRGGELWDGHVSYNRERDLLWLFSSFSSTLESIVLVGDSGTVAPSPIIHVYPRLTHLTVPRSGMPFVRPYINAFPALRVLQFDYSFIIWGTGAVPTHSLFTHTLRDKSSEELRTHNREDQVAHGSWGALEDFMGMTLDVYIAGLTCRIPKLHLITWGGTVDAEISAICTIFADARPSVFRLALRPERTDYITALFYERVELFSSLSSLELRLDVAAVPFDFKLYLDSVGPALQRLPIVSLQVEIKCLAHRATRKVHEPKYCDIDSDDVQAGCYTLAAMSGEDVQARLRSLLQQVPTLRRVTIAWGRCFLRIPHRFVTIDLDNIPHTTERSGRRTDQYWQDGYKNWY